MMFPFFKKNKNVANQQTMSPNISRKNIFTDPSIQYLAYGNDQLNNVTLTSLQSLNIYSSVAPVSTAIDKVADAGKSVDIILLKQSGDKEDPIYQHPILDFLKSPNADQTQRQFLEGAYKNYLITGECFLLASHLSGNRIGELVVVSPSCIQNVELANDGFVKSYRMSLQGGGSVTFNRDDKTFRFFTADKSFEIWHIKSFNPFYNGRGYSELNQIYDEIDQYARANGHNISLLKNGMRPSAAFISKDGLTDDQYTRAQDQIDSQYSGSKNAGRPILLEGLDIKEMMLTNRDMDFGRLTKETEEIIAKRYKIPTPLISNESMTFSNLDASSYLFYDNAVLPLVDLINAELTLFLGKYFKLDNNTSLNADKSKISALQSRLYDQVKVRKEIGVETTDEYRSLLQRESLESGGNDVLAPANMVPIGSDAYTEDNRTRSNSTTESQDSNNDLEDVDALSKSQFIEIMQKQTDKKGVRIYSDDEISELATEGGYVH